MLDLSTTGTPLDGLVQEEIRESLEEIRKGAIRCAQEELQKLPEFEIRRRKLPAVKLPAVKAQQAYIRCLGGETQRTVAGDLMLVDVEGHRLLGSIDDQLCKALRAGLGKDNFVVWLNSSLDNALWEMEERLQERLRKRRLKEERLQERLRKRRLKRALEKVREELEKELPIWQTAFKRRYVAEKKMSTWEISDELRIPHKELCRQLEAIKTRIYETLREELPELEDDLSNSRGRCEGGPMIDLT